jgi:hypothetical protein
LELDRQSIEKRDFPIARRGYDPVAVDTHLRSLAAGVEEIQHTLGSRSAGSLGSSAAEQVQGILDAAETAAADIERQAAEDARRMRADAQSDSERTRTEAIERAQAHVEAVSRATAVLLGRVESMDGEVGALVQSLQAGAGRLAEDLRSLEANMGELYGEASAGATRAGAPDVAAPATPTAAEPGGDRFATPAVPAARAAAMDEVERALLGPPTANPDVQARPVHASASPTISASEPSAHPRAPAPAPAASVAAATPESHIARPATAMAPANEDLDGARLIALNMALNGESREQAERYLAENFQQLGDRAKLLDEVYAAIQG